VEDLETARALLQTAEAWLRERGMAVIRGPFNFSTNEECGFLARGFDSPPVFMMPYTKPYYLDFMAAADYRPARDLLAYYYEDTGEIPPHLVRFAERAGERTGIVVRKLDLKHFDEEVERVFEVYNRAWEKNWGFIPMIQEEFKFAAKSFRQVIDPALALVAEKDGRAVGFSLGLPDYNVVFKKMKGRLLPFGFLYFLLGRRSIHRVRVITLGVIEEYRNRGVETLLIYHTFRNGLPKGYTSCEMSWVLEDNVLARRMFERMGAVPYKTYRIYEKTL
jgi:GNAT superfamily N-acetyltransferase